MRRDLRARRVILISGVSQAEKASLSKIIKQLGGEYLESDVSVYRPARGGRLCECFGWIQDYKLNTFRPKKKLFVSCNPTLTSFYSKKSLP